MNNTEEILSAEITRDLISIIVPSRIAAMSFCEPRSCS